MAETPRNHRSWRQQFNEGERFAGLRPLYDAVDRFLFSSGEVTSGAPHVRDTMDMKRMMITVVFALLPTVVMALYNTGLQANLALQHQGALGAPGWRGWLLSSLNVGVDSVSIVGNILHGALYFIPVYFVAVLVGAIWEILFACVRKLEVSEGFLVTSLLYALILPPLIPLWQVALGISFGIVMGKEVFGGVGMNILNPALVGRCFLFFSYPQNLSGDGIWVAADGYSMATPLARLASPEVPEFTSWHDAFWGFIPGSMGETSTFACLLGAAILIVSQVASWRVMLAVVLGMTSAALIFNAIGSQSNPMFAVTPLWHLVIGGFAFGTVYMATDPVTSAHSEGGQWIYGGLIGALTVLVRVINPGYTEGMMLAILFANVFAPAIDSVVVSRRIIRRQRRIRP
ncbi:MAG: NADH:ubiquinone reductase (Na(+)-transporting) subunit B [Gammaproteobacteria bacterium]